MTEEPIPHPGVKFPPPLLFVAGFLGGWAMHRRWPHRLVPGGGSDVAEIVGALIMALGLAIIGWAFSVFLAHRTAIYPNQPAARVVRDGPFRYTRNPMYVGMAMLYMGLAIVVNALLPLLLLPVVLSLLVTLVIEREERYLTSAFGQDYAQYCRDVRRWM